MEFLEYSEAALWKPPSRNFVHNCNHCPFMSTSMFLLQNHVKSHRLSKTLFSCENSIEAYFCEDCSVHTPLTLIFKKHIEENHIAKPENDDEFQYSVQSYICKNCSFETCFSLAWLKHATTCKRKPRAPIKTEEQEFFTCSTYVKKDMDKYCTDENGQLYCPNCGRTFSHKREVQRHITLFHQGLVQYFECDKCPYKCKKRVYFTNHMQQHSNIREFKCEKCEFVGTNQAGLNSHDYFRHQIHNEWLECAQCTFKTRFKISFNNHISGKHKPEDANIEWLRCHHCPYKTQQKMHLMRHMIGKHKVRSEFPCDQCPYQAINMRRLTAHKLRHVEVIQWLKCEDCSFKTKSKSSLKMHRKRRHSLYNEWFECDQCVYKSFTRTILKVHIQMKHMREDEVNWLKCDQCGFKTLSRRRLNGHILCKHTPDDEINWYKCELCSYKAKTKYSWRNHITAKHGKMVEDAGTKWFECNLCNCAFKAEAHLEDHQKEIHAEK